MASGFNSGIGERNVALENIGKLAKALSVSPRETLRGFSMIPELTSAGDH
jgi:hypothetical protein